MAHWSDEVYPDLKHGNNPPNPNHHTLSVRGEASLGETDYLLFYQVINDPANVTTHIFNFDFIG